jgi:hypothetical protein
VYIKFFAQGMFQLHFHDRIGMQNAREEDQSKANKLLFPVAHRMSTVHAGCNERTTTAAL